MTPAYAPARATPTAQERRVVHHLSHGHTDTEVGALLGIARVTVKTRAEVLTERVGLLRVSRAVLVDLAYRHGWLELPVTSATPAALKPREWQMLHAIRRGLLNREIGAELYLSLDTVKTHVAALLRALDARNRAHAVGIAHRTGLLGGHE